MRPWSLQPRPLTATISREAFLTKLLPTVPLDHRAIVAIGGGAGLRWVRQPVSRGTR